MRKGGIVTKRRRARERRGKIRHQAAMTICLLILGAACSAPPVRKGVLFALQRSMIADETFASGSVRQSEIVLDEMEVFALQLGVFDSDERAKAQQRNLLKKGVDCFIWKRDKLRVICDAAPSRETLDKARAAGNEAYVVRDFLPAVRLRLTGSEQEIDAAKTLMQLPAMMLNELLSHDGMALDTLMKTTVHAAQKAASKTGENECCMALLDRIRQWQAAVEMEMQNASARDFAALTLCSLYREWRSELLSVYSPSEESTASAQRTPSTAADVMPPA